MAPLGVKAPHPHPPPRSHGGAGPLQEADAGLQGSRQRSHLGLLCNSTESRLRVATSPPLTVRVCSALPCQRPILSLRQPDARMLCRLSGDAGEAAVIWVLEVPLHPLAKVSVSSPPRWVWRVGIWGLAPEGQ